MEREAVPIERRAQLAIAHSRVHRHRPRLAIERHDRFHLAQREKMVGAVGNPVEAVPGAEHLEVRVLSDELLDLRERGRRRDAVGAVLGSCQPNCAAAEPARPQPTSDQSSADTADVLTTATHCPTKRRRL